MSEHRDEPERLLILSRAFAAGPAGATAAQLRDALQLLRPQAPTSAVDAEREEWTRVLFRDGQLEPERRRMVCSVRGEERLRAGLGLRGGTRPTWTALRDGVLLVAALGLPQPDEAQLRRFRTAGGVRAAALARVRRLPVSPYPTASEALGAAGWTELAGLLGEALADWRRLPFGSGAVVSCVLGHRLGLRRALSASQLLGLLAAHAVGARGADVRALRAAILAGWRERSAGAGPSAAPIAAPAEGLDPPAAFAAAVRAAAVDCPVGRFGRGLVFVADLFEAFAARHPGGVADLAAFKQRLLDAGRSGLLSLVRADLVEAMDPQIVRRSEIRDLHATFHFVRV
jgi:hypothetical protein